MSRRNFSEGIYPAKTIIGNRCCNEPKKVLGACATDNGWFSLQQNIRARSSSHEGFTRATVFETYLDWKRAKRFLSTPIDRSETTWSSGERTCHVSTEDALTSELLGLCLDQKSSIQILR